MIVNGHSGDELNIDFRPMGKIPAICAEYKTIGSGAPAASRHRGPV